MSSRAKAKAKGNKEDALSIEQLQEENARLRKLLEFASSAAGHESQLDRKVNVIKYDPQTAAAAKSIAGAGEFKDAKGGSRSHSRERQRIQSKERPKSREVPPRDRAAEQARRPWQEKSLIEFREEKKAKYYAEDLRAKTPQEVAEEKQEHEVREGQWRGRQEGKHQATALLEKPSIALKAGLEKLTIDTGSGTAAGAALGSPPHEHAKILREHSLPPYRPTTAEKAASSKRNTPKAASGKSSTWGNGSSSNGRGSPTSSSTAAISVGAIPVMPLGGENAMLIDRKELPTVEQIPTDTVVKGMEVDISKIPLPLTANQVEVQTALITGIRPHLPSAEAFDADLQQGRVEANLETPDGRPVMQTRARSPEDRPSSRGPALDFTGTMQHNLSVERDQVRSRGDGTAGKRQIKERIQAEALGEAAPQAQMGFLPYIDRTGAGAGVGAGAAARHDGMGIISAPSNAPVGVLGAGSVDSLEGATGDILRGQPAPVPTWHAYPSTTGSIDAFPGPSTQQHLQQQEVLNTAVSIDVPTNNKGFPQELLPVHSEFLTGIMNRKRPPDESLLYQNGAAPSVFNAPQHPLCLTMLVSTKGLWKAQTTQVYDPNLYLTMHPPPPDRIVLSIVDIVGMYTGMGVMHGGNNVVQNSTATVTINVREYTLFLYELINKYNDNYVLDTGEPAGTPAGEGSNIPHVSRVFEPSSLEWWRKYARYALVVRSKPNGQMLAKISKRLLDRLVQTLLINNSVANLGLDHLYDRSNPANSAGMNMLSFLGSQHHDHESERIHSDLWIHSWDFEHVQPVDHGAVIHQVGWSNTYGRSEQQTSLTGLRAPSPTLEPPEPVVVAESTPAPESAEDVSTSQPPPQPPAAIDLRNVGLDPNSGHNVLAMPAGDVHAGVTFEDPEDASNATNKSLASSSARSGNSKRQKKKKKATLPASTIPDEIMARDARFEVSHMMIFNAVTDTDSKVLTANQRVHDATVASTASSSIKGGGSLSSTSLNSEASKATLKARNQQNKQQPGAPMNGAAAVQQASAAVKGKGDENKHGSRHASPNLEHYPKHEHHQHFDDHIPKGTPNPTHPHLHHEKTHAIHTFAGDRSKGDTGVIVVHGHHEQTVAERMNSPNAMYRVMPNRSTSPGFFGGESQKGKEGDFAGGYWNDNTDVRYEETPNLRATNGVPAVEKKEPRPELFVDDEREKARHKKKKEKEAKAALERGRASPSPPKREYLTAEQVARKTIIRAREVVSTNTRFRQRKLTEVEAAIFRSPFAIPLVTEKMRLEAEALE